MEKKMAKVVLEKPKEKQPRRSTEKPSAWELGGLTWLQLTKRVWKSMDAEHDDTFGRAAELAYYSFLAVFPGLLFLLTMLGIVTGNNPEFRNTLLQYAGRAVPPEAWTLVQKTLQETAQAASGWKLIVFLLGALWSASAGMSSFMTVLNFAYHVREKRPFWKARLLIAPALTIAMAILMFAALAIVLFGNAAATWAGAHGLGTTAVIAWKVLQWPVALFFVMLGFAVLYYFAPDVEDQKWYWITPGSVIGVLLWVAASALFRVYLAFFNSYSATYGSLGAVIVLMLWFYITALAVLVGAEINAEIEHAAAEHGRADAKLKGEKEAPAA
jgi:membrane protein